MSGLNTAVSYSILAVTIRALEWLHDHAIVRVRFSFSLNARIVRYPDVFNQLVNSITDISLLMFLYY